MNIDDVTVKIVRGIDYQTNRAYKELVIGYKTIFLNIFQVTVQDLSGESLNSTFCRHESFHLWETKIFGLITSKNKDFITLSKAGMNVLTMNTKEQRSLVDATGQNKMIHSIVSFDFLKLENTNLINFKCQDYNYRIIGIE